jgi:outer membrane lipoprotein-sorting protein
MLKYRFVFLLVYFLPVFALAQVKGFGPLADEAGFKKKFAETAAATNSIKCDFVQEKNLLMLSEKIISKGTFVYKKAQKVRMEYTHPFSYLLVINQDKVTIKDRQKTNSFSSKSNKMFENINKIVMDCVQGTALENPGFTVKIQESELMYLLILVPKKKEMKEFFSTIKIYIDKKNYSVSQLVMEEPTGDNTAIQFVNKQYNLNIPDATFIVH